MMTTLHAGNTTTSFLRRERAYNTSINTKRFYNKKVDVSIHLFVCSALLFNYNFTNMNEIS